MAFDFVVFSVVVISVFMGFFRGFAKEFFTILSWVLATIITTYLSPVVQGLFEVSEGKKAFYDAVSVLIMFSLSMVFFSFVFGRIIHHLKKNDCMFLDRSLGVFFGFVRAALLVCLGYIFIVGFVYDSKPDWLQGKSVKIVEIGAKQLMKWNPKNLDLNIENWINIGGDKLEVKDIEEDVLKQESKKAFSDVEFAMKIRNKINEMTTEPDGYSEETREEINKLIEDGIL